MTARVGVIGYGYWGPNLVRNFHQLGALAAVCDRDERRLGEVRRLYPTARCCTDVADLWSDPTIDAVAIATPVASHASLGRTALEAGKHLLMEKPLALSSADCRALIALAARQERILMVGHTFEYNPAVHKLKALLEDRELGDLYYIYSTRVNLGRIQRDLNALWSIAPHDVSILLYLLGTMPEEVRAHGASYLTPGIEDVVFLNLAFSQGVTAHVHVSWLDPSKVRLVTLVGSQKMAIYDDLDNEGKIRIYDKGAFREGSVYGEYQHRLHSGDISIPQIDLSEPLNLECAHFLQCVETGQRPLSDGESGLRVVRVLETAQESLKQGGAPVRCA